MTVSPSAELATRNAELRPPGLAHPPPGAILTLVTAALFVEMMLYEMVVSFLPQELQQEGDSGSEIGLLFASYGVGLLLATPVVGRWTRRVGGRTILLAGVVGLMLAMLLSAAAGHLAVFMAARFLHGVAGAVLWAAGLAWVAEAYPPARRGQALGTAMAGLSLGTLVGPTLGGAIYEWGGQPAPFLAGALLAGLLGSFALALPAGRPVRGPGRASFRALVRRPGVISTLGAVALGSTLLTLLEPTLPLHLASRMGLGPARIGMLFAAGTLAYGLAAPLAGRLASRRGPARMMAVGLAGAVVALPCLALPHHWTLEVLVLVSLGTACAFLLTPTLPLLASAAEQDGPGGWRCAYSLFNLANAVGILIGPTLGGLLTAQLGFLACLLLVSAAAAACVPWLASLRD